MRPLASPLIPEDVSVHKRLRVISHAFNGGTVRCRRALPSAACTFIKQIVFALVPRVTKAVLAHKFVAGVVQIFQPLVNVRTEQAMLVVDYGP